VNPGFSEEMEVTRARPERPSRTTSGTRTTGWESLLWQKIPVFCFFLFVFLSPFHFIDNLLWYWRLCCRIGRLDDLVVFHQSFV